ncbi:MAG TPA: hypothetical protein VD994_03555 [Prosthecobacter sp.]|nr:hypothetical protein [Prosthecobacter sp.]
MEKLLESMAANVPGIVGVIIVVFIFVKSNRGAVELMKEQSAACHLRTKEDREAYQKQVAAIVDRQEKMAESYQQGMMEFAKSIGKNGEILIRMERALVHTHRRASDPIVREEERS